jgi:hypothetical protein
VTATQHEQTGTDTVTVGSMVEGFGSNTLDRVICRVLDPQPWSRAERGLGHELLMLSGAALGQ